MRHAAKNKIQHPKNMRALFLLKVSAAGRRSSSITFVILFFNEQVLNFSKVKTIICPALQIPIFVTAILQKLNLQNMKKIILGILLIGLTHFANAQIKGILDRAKTEIRPVVS